MNKESISFIAIDIRRAHDSKLRLHKGSQVVPSAKISLRNFENLKGRSLGKIVNLSLRNFAKIPREKVP